MEAGLAPAGRFARHHDAGDLIGEEIHMASTDTSRRDFLLQAAGWTAAIGLGPYLGACESCKPLFGKRPIRKSLATLGPNDPIIKSYREAVAAMKALPSTDLRSWQHQAEIHNNFCPHGNWFFLPWHRAYLYYFERICRKLSGNKHFALPYWDWTVDPHVPTPFWSGTLLDNTRGATSTSTASPAVVGRPVIDSILAETDFLIFASGVATTPRPSTVYGRLEATPHNSVHGFVGGNMSSFMSPLDPVFWTHHNMIECLWVDWNVVKGNANTNDNTWRNYNFTSNFADENGSPVDITVLATLLMPILSYQFDGNCGGGTPGAGTAQADTSAAMKRFLQSGAPPRVEILRRFELQRAFEVSTETPASAAIPIEAGAVKSVVERPETERLLLTIGDLRQPRENSFFVRVFVNLPDASPTTPIEDPHYAGSFAFFNDPKAMPEHPEGGGAVIVDLSETVRRLSRGNELRGTAVSLKLVAVPIRPDVRTRESFGARRLELALARVREKQPR
jgi:tyrosinase